MTGHTARAADGDTPYRRRVDLYDLLHRRKPYRLEAAQVRAAAAAWAQRPARTLLDVACGTGRHLEQFVRWFDVTGVDASRPMLARARARVPQARLLQGRMESFDLGRPFDLVTCLFSAIGYARDRRELRSVARNLARHTAPGGVVVVEPWLTPGAFRPGLVHTMTAVVGGTRIVRMNGSALRRGRSVFDFHHLVGADGTVEHFVERHDLGLFTRAEMEGALRAAGLVVRYDPRGLSARRGLYLGRQPL